MIITYSPPKYIYAIFIIGQVFLTQDYGFLKFKSKRLQRFVHICSVVQCSIVTSAIISLYLFAGNTADFIWRGLALVEYVVITLVLIYTNVQNITFYNFLQDVIAIDGKSQLIKKRVFIRLFIDLTTLLFIRVILSATYFYCEEIRFTSPLLYCITRTTAFAYIFPSITCFSMFKCVHTCLKGLLESLKVTETVHYKRSALSYKALCDVFDKYRFYQDKIFTSTLLLNMPKLLILSHSFVTRYKTGVDYSTELLVNLTFSCLESLIALFAPAVAAGQLHDEIANLRVALHDHLLQTRGRHEQEEIRLFIKYLKARPMKYYACKVIPIGWRLPVIALNFFITYTIVIMQFININS